MTNPPLIQRLTLLALFAVGLALPAAAQVSAQLTSRHLARGEQTFLEIVLPGQPANAEPYSRLRIPAIPEVTVTPFSEGVTTRSAMGRRREYVVQFVVQSYTLGHHTIPAIEVPTDHGPPLRTQPVDFVVFDPATLDWQETTIAQQVARYSVGFRLLNEHPYPGEAVPVEIKLYLAYDAAVRIDDWGVPEFETDGVACWRLEPAPMKGQFNLLNRTYIAVAYTSTLAPTREGELGIGPAKLRLTAVQAIFDPLTGPRNIADEAKLAIPKLAFHSTPLPPGAPAGFDNAIGAFTLRASTAQTEVREGDPIAVDLVVTGSGNLDTLRPPRLQDPKSWKVYEASATQRGDERRQLSGSVIFQQLIKPLNGQTSIPPFHLSFFDPVLKQYRTITTAAIPLKVIPSPTTAALPAAPPQALPVPLERMTDILSNLRPASLVATPGVTFPPWTGHAVAALLALLLAAKACWLRLIPRLARKPRLVLEARALAELAKLPPDDDLRFLKQAGAFIERWLGGVANPDLQGIIAERDRHCFRADATGFALGKRRAEILRTLRKAIHTTVALALLGGILTTQPLQAEGAPPPPPAPAASADLATRAQAAYDSAEFEEAVRLWLEAGTYDQLAPDTLYNIGNACYRLGSPGHAALFYRRALVRDPGHAESRQNLRFIERKCGAITIQRPEYQYSLARIPLVYWRGAVWTGCWLAVLGLLAFPATRTGARLRIPATAAIIAAPMLAAAGLLGWHYYPDDSTFAPLPAQAVVITDKLILHTDASRTSPEVIEAPAGSLCQIVRSTGDWVYISFASQTRGWVPADAVERIIPPGLPKPPRIRKPAATERTA